MPIKEIIKTDTGATIGIWQLTETVTQLEKQLPTLAQSKKYSTLNHQLRKLEWLGARALMKELQLGWELQYTENGKPFYSNGPKISLTHSKDYIAIITHHFSEVGIDVQEIVEKVTRIKHKFCNAQELEWAKTTEDFTLIWSAKEAVFKIKEKNVLFKEDILVIPAADGLNLTFRATQKLKGEVLQLDGYQCVYAVENERLT